MKKEKKKKGRRAYLNDFQKNGAGGYVYKGDLYRYTAGEKQRKKDLLLLWVWYASAVIVAIAAGCLPAEGLGRSALVLLPYLVEVGGLAAVGWALCRITAGGELLRAYVYESSVLKINRRTWVAMIGAAATLVGGIVFVSWQGFCANWAADLAFLVMHPVVFAGVWGAKKQAGKMKWSK